MPPPPSLFWVCCCGISSAAGRQRPSSTGNGRLARHCCRPEIRWRGDAFRLGNPPIRSGRGAPVVPGKLSGKPGTTPAATKPPGPRGGLMMHGGTDEPEPAVRKLVEKLNPQKAVHVDYRVFAGADHIYAEHADAVSVAVEDHVGKVIARRQMALAAD